MAEMIPEVYQSGVPSEQVGVTGSATKAGQPKSSSAGKNDPMTEKFSEPAMPPVKSSGDVMD